MAAMPQAAIFSPLLLARQKKRADCVIAAQRRSVTHRPARLRPLRSDKVWSHPSATVSIDLQANTASASRGLDGLKRQLQSLQVQARASSSTLGGAWSGLKAQNKFTIGSGLALASLDMVSSLLPAAVSDSSIGKALTSAAQGATRLGTMLAPLGPVGIAAGAAVGGVTSAIRSLAESALAAKKEIEAAAKAEWARGLRHNDYIGEEAWRRKNADAAERGKIQSESPERIEKARFKLARGMSISESDAYCVANWDRAAQGVSLYMFQHTRPHGARPKPMRPFGPSA